MKSHMKPVQFLISMSTLFGFLGLIAVHADPGAPQTCRAMAVVYRRRSKWSELGALAVECADRAKSPEERAGWLAQAVDAYGHVEAPPV